MQIGVNGFDHQVVIVSLEKKDYVVDVGFGGQVKIPALKGLRGCLNADEGCPQV